MENIVAVIANQKRVEDCQVPLWAWGDFEEGSRRKHEAARREKPLLPGARVSLMRFGHIWELFVPSGKVLLRCDIWCRAGLPFAVGEVHLVSFSLAQSWWWLGPLWKILEDPHPGTKQTEEAREGWPGGPTPQSGGQSSTAEEFLGKLFWEVLWLSGDF